MHRIRLAATCLALVFAAPYLTAQSHTTTESVLLYSTSTGPYGNIIQANDGNIYGISKDENSIVKYIPAAPGFIAAPSVTTVHTKTGTNGDTGTYWGLIEGTDGNFYGVSSNGGVNSYGSIFKITPGGVFTTLYSFCSQSLCTDGQYPQPGLVQGTDGYLYGAASNGGNTSTENGTSGTLFRINTAGEFSVLYAFCPGSGTCPDGSEPSSGLIQGNDGNFYGVAQNGGANTVPLSEGGSIGAGVLYQITPSGQYSVIYNFGSGDNFDDGAFPTGQILDSGNDTFYGYVPYIPEGSYPVNSALYLIGANGSYSQVLLYCSPSSIDCSESDPNGYGEPGLPILISGDLERVIAYGYGGANLGNSGGSGALASLDGLYSYSFCSLPDCADGSTPSGAAIQANDGSYYGTLSNNGTVSGMYRVVFLSDGLALSGGPIAITSSAENLLVGQTADISWSVDNATSATLKQCVAWFNGTSLGQVPLTGSASYKPNTPGMYLASITCGGVETGLVRLVVTSTPIATTTTLTAPSSALAGAALTLSGRVVKQGSTPGVPSGTVTIKANGTAIATVPVQPSGSYTLSSTGAGIVAGTYSLVATYNGDGGDTASSSAPASLTVTKQSSTTGISAFPNPVPANQEVELTTTVYGATDNPKGTVTFSYNGAALATVGLTASTENSSTAQFTASASGLPAGTYAIKAAYSGDSVNLPSSGTVSVTVE